MLPGFARIVQVFDSSVSNYRAIDILSVGALNVVPFGPVPTRVARGEAMAGSPYMQAHGITFVIPRLKLSYRVCKFLVRIQPCPCET
jgi:hypothetical protein